jgi:PAS domain S-box-containing protein
MAEEFVILCCENIRPEVDAVLAGGGMPRASVRSFPFHCGHVRSVWETVRNQYDELERAGATTCLCGCGCSNAFDIPREVLARPALRFIGSGPSLFLPESLVEYWQKNRKYLKLPGRLLKWKENTDCDNLSRSIAQEMYHESVDEIIILDTGIRCGIEPVIAEYADFYGLPVSIIPVGTELLRHHLTAQYREWEFRQEAEACRASARLSDKRVADYSMIADLTGKLIGMHDEKAIILQMLDLVFLLSSPKKVGFLPFGDGGFGEIISIPGGAYSSSVHFQRIPDPITPYFVTDSRDGFLIPVKSNDHTLGILSVDQAALPENLDEYINISQFIGQIGGLSITIARAHQALVRAVAERDAEISERTRAESALRESEEKFRTIIENIQDVYFRFDRDSRLVMASPSAAVMFGYPSVSDMLGMPALSLWKDKEKEALLHNAMMQQGGAIQDWVAEFLKRDGTPFWVSISGHIHMNEKGEVQGAEGIIRDISERKKTDDALKGALTKLNMLSSITRHDILNQIMGLRTYLELSREDLKGSKFERFIDKEIQATDAIQRQIEFTKFYQDIGVNAPKWQDAGEVIREAASQLNPAGIDVQVGISGIDIFADPLIVKVFFNLMENSIRHGEHVSTMSFTSSRTESGLVIIYQDNGVGIPPEDKLRLFQKGFGKHTGLGLFLSREILAITEISIRETGVPGKGARFEIAVPKEGYRQTR